MSVQTNVPLSNNPVSVEFVGHITANTPPNLSNSGLFIDKIIALNTKPVGVVLEKISSIPKLSVK